VYFVVIGYHSAEVCNKVPALVTSMYRPSLIQMGHNARFRRTILLTVLSCLAE